MKKILHLGVVGTAILTMTTTIACSAVDNRDEDNSYNNSDQIDKKLNDLAIYFQSQEIANQNMLPSEVVVDASNFESQIYGIEKEDQKYQELSAGVTYTDFKSEANDKTGNLKLTFTMNLENRVRVYQQDISGFHTNENLEANQLNDLNAYFLSQEMANKNQLASVVQATESDFLEIVYGIDQKDQTYQELSAGVTYTNFELKANDKAGSLTISFTMNLNQETFDFTQTMVGFYVSNNAEIDQLKALSAFLLDHEVINKNFLPSEIRADVNNFEQVIYGIKSDDATYQQLSAEVTYTNFEIITDDEAGTLDLRFTMNLKDKSLNFNQKISGYYTNGNIYESQLNSLASYFKDQKLTSKSLLPSQVEADLDNFWQVVYNIETNDPEYTTRAKDVEYSNLIISPNDNEGILTIGFTMNLNGKTQVFIDQINNVYLNEHDIDQQLQDLASYFENKEITNQNVLPSNINATAYDFWQKIYQVSEHDQEYNSKSENVTYSNFVTVADDETGTLEVSFTMNLWNESLDYRQKITNVYLKNDAITQQLEDLANYFTYKAISKKTVKPSTVHATTTSFTQTIYDISEGDATYEAKAENVSYSNFEITAFDYSGVLKVSFTMNLGGKTREFYQYIYGVYTAEATASKRLSDLNTYLSNKDLLPKKEFTASEVHQITTQKNYQEIIYDVKPGDDEFYGKYGDITYTNFAITTYNQNGTVYVKFTMHLDGASKAFDHTVEPGIFKSYEEVDKQINDLITYLENKNLTTKNMLPSQVVATRDNFQKVIFEIEDDDQTYQKLSTGVFYSALQLEADDTNGILKIKINVNYDPRWKQFEISIQDVYRKK